LKLHPLRGLGLDETALLAIRASMPAIACTSGCPSMTVVALVQAAHARLKDCSPCIAIAWMFASDTALLLIAWAL
jgi:hypothetical protein